MKNSTLYKTTIISIFYVVSILTEAGVQNCATYFPLSKGASYEFEMFNAKQKKTGGMVYIIQDVQAGSAKTEAQIVQEFYDEKDKKSTEKNYTLYCDNNGQMMIDMRAFMNTQTMEPYQDMEMKMEGDYLIFPANLQVGETLPEGNMTTVMSNRENGTTAPVVRMRIYNRMVEGKESITCTAGTYDCYKINYDMKVENVAIGIPIAFNLKVTEWIAPGKGLIKSESFRSNGKSMGYSVLSKAI